MDNRTLSLQQDYPSQAPRNDQYQLIIDTLRSIIYPEIPLNIVDLGLVYRVEILRSDFIRITMSLTRRQSPASHSIPAVIEGAVRQLPGITQVQVNLVWDPPWTMEYISESAKKEMARW